LDSFINGRKILRPNFQCQISTFSKCMQFYFLSQKNLFRTLHKAAIRGQPFPFCNSILKCPVFAAGIDKSMIEKGAEMVEIELTNLIADTIMAYGK